MNKISHFLTRRPERLIIYSFVLAITIGACLLKLPIAATRTSLDWIDAFFMATSAVCVTGLSVIDIGRDLTLFGQLVTLTLIQLGGLGIMTFSLLFLIMLGKKISLPFQLCAPDLSQDLSFRNFRYSLIFVFAMTFAIESAGAVLLFGQFRLYHPVGFAVYSSIFHSVAAFCNSGLSLYSDSLMKFSGNAPVLLILMGLIITGGLGFIVVHEIFHVIKHRKHNGRCYHFSLHAKIALAGSLIFIVTGTLIIWLLEKGNLLQGLPAGRQVLNAMFLSVTSRTAGFNAIDTAALTNTTLFFVMLLMFVGGCPGSTAGGIKIHTFFTLIVLLINRINGFSMASIFKRKIPDETVSRALTVFISSAFLIILAIFLLQLSEDIDPSNLRIKERASFINTCFEAVSAFGTVGLSTGITPRLAFPSKLIIMALMLIGRVGALTLGIALQIRQQKRITYDFPKEDIMVS